MSSIIRNVARAAKAAFGQGQTAAARAASSGVPQAQPSLSESIVKADRGEKEFRPDTSHHHQHGDGFALNKRETSEKAYDTTKTWSATTDQKRGAFEATKQFGSKQSDTRDSLQDPRADEARDAKSRLNRQGLREQQQQETSSRFTSGSSGNMESPEMGTSGARNSNGNDREESSSKVNENVGFMPGTTEESMRAKTDINSEFTSKNDQPESFRKSGYKVDGNIVTQNAEKGYGSSGPAPGTSNRNSGSSASNARRYYGTQGKQEDGRYPGTTEGQQQNNGKSMSELFGDKLKQNAQSVPEPKEGANRKDFQKHDAAMRAGYAATSLPGSESDHTTWATGAAQKAMKKGDQAGAAKDRD